MGGGEGLGTDLHMQARGWAQIRRGGGTRHGSAHAGEGLGTDQEGGGGGLDTLAPGRIERRAGPTRRGGTGWDRVKEEADA